MAEFKIRHDIKQGYLNEKATDTAASSYYILRTLDEYEEMLGKDVFDMNISELEGLVLRYNNSSLKSSCTTVSILRKYIDYCISKGLVTHQENKLVLFDSKKLKKYVSIKALENRYITPEQLREYEDALVNVQDKALLRLPYVGVRGRTTKDGSYEEIINLQINPLDEYTANNRLKLIKNNGDVRILEVDSNTMGLLIDTLECEEYVGNNGEIVETLHGGVRRSIINKYGGYVFRKPSKNKHEIFDSNFIPHRMWRIQKYLGNKYITTTNLYNSGMITMAKDIVAKNGEITHEDYIAIATRFDCPMTDKYLWSLKDIIKPYL